MEPGSEQAAMQLATDEVQEERLQCFLRWLRANGVQLRSSQIKRLEGIYEGLGVFSANDHTEGAVMVTPLLLAITPMRVLQDSYLGNEYGKLFEDGDVDDRLLMILFLLVERIRGPSSFWAPYLDVLPTRFGTPLWLTEQELQELKGTVLYNATKIQLKNLKALFYEKVKPLVERFLSLLGALGREVEFKEFLWANCIFWTRALNIPCPHLFVFPRQLPTSTNANAVSQRIGQPISSSLAVTGDLRNREIAEERLTWEQSTQQTIQGEQDAVSFPESRGSAHFSFNQDSREASNRDVEDLKICVDGGEHGNTRNGVPTREEEATVWVEGLVPGIDFCNHDPRGVAHWEVDREEGSVTGVPYSMYLMTETGVALPAGKEILISYGNKGNEELLFFYGFVVEDNPDDYLMVHFPKEALDQDPCADTKFHLLQEQKLSLRWLLPTSLLQKGFFSQELDVLSDSVEDCGQVPPSGYSWSGNRKPPSYSNRCVFPEEVIAALRVIAMKEDDLQTVVSMLEELSESGLQRPPSGEDVRAAVWEVCGNAGALQMLTDLLASRMLDLEEGTGSEASDKELIERDFQTRIPPNTRLNSCEEKRLAAPNSLLPENARACIIYRRGQKHLTLQFLKESERLLDLCISEEQVGS